MIFNLYFNILLAHFNFCHDIHAPHTLRTLESVKEKFVEIFFFGDIFTKATAL